MEENQYLLIKNKLNQAWCAKREMDKYNELMNKARSAVEKVTPSYSLALGGSNADSDKMANYAVEIEELYTRAEEATKTYLQAVKDVDDLINILDNPLHIAVLRRRYLGGDRWEAIALELGYSLRRIHQLHHEAIDMLAYKNIR